MVSDGWYTTETKLKFLTVNYCMLPQIYFTLNLRNFHSTAESLIDNWIPFVTMSRL